MIDTLVEWHRKGYIFYIAVIIALILTPIYGGIMGLVWVVIGFGSMGLLHAVIYLFRKH